MRRRTLDMIFSSGAIVLAALLLILGLVLQGRAEFARNYVSDELGQQSFGFRPVEELLPEERAFTEARSGCVIEYAGQDVTSGAQAECFANEYLGGHLTWLATRLGMTQVAYVDGMNFVELGQEQGRLRGAIAEAEDAGDGTSDELTQQLEDVTTVRTKMFEGTMLRNALLTVYGFSELGESAAIAATGAFIAAGLLFLLAIAGFIHALVTPRDRKLGLFVPSGDGAVTREPVGV